MSTWRPTGSDPDGDLPRPVRQSLDGVARALAGADSGVMTVVFSHWDSAVGSAVAEHAQPVSLRAGVLSVVVTEPAWATQLRFLESEILQRLAEAAGRPVATHLEVRVRPTGRRRGRS